MLNMPVNLQQNPVTLKLENKQQEQQQRPGASYSQ